jgi:hypothetical protein
VCEEGLQCLTTRFGRRCTTTCEPFSCPEGQLCLFGVCVDQECQTDDDCGGAPEHYCDKFLQCRKRTACKTQADCKTWNKPHYCDLDVGFCMEDGNCFKDSDCPGGTCGPDHWCFGHNCSLPDAPGCPPSMPICDIPEGDMPLCDGQTCGTCIAPCVFDSDCPPGKECQGSWCYTPGNDCILDSECAQGQYCHPGCTALKPTCQTEADCTDYAGKLCIAGFCGGPNEVLTCQDDAPCMAWREGYTCQDGVSKPEGGCVLDSQCKPGEYCGQVCLPIPELPECKTDAGCPAGQVCDNQGCQVPPECNFHSQCPVGHVCKDQHCYNDQGVCAWMEKGPGFCDDGDPCTVDSCDAQTGCVHESGGCENAGGMRAGGLLVSPGSAAAGLAHESGEATSPPPPRRPVPAGIRPPGGSQARHCPQPRVCWRTAQPIPRTRLKRLGRRVARTCGPSWRLGRRVARTCGPS